MYYNPTVDKETKIAIRHFCVYVRSGNAKCLAEFIEDWIDWANRWPNQRHVMRGRNLHCRTGDAVIVYAKQDGVINDRQYTLLRRLDQCFTELVGKTFLDMRVMPKL